MYRVSLSSIHRHCLYRVFSKANLFTYDISLQLDTFKEFTVKCLVKQIVVKPNCKRMERIRTVCFVGQLKSESLRLLCLVVRVSDPQFG